MGAHRSCGQLKSHVRQTKDQIRIDYDWDGKEANFADLVSTIVKE